MANRRRAVLGVAVGLLLVVAIGVLGILHATALDPEAIKAELQKKIDDLHRIPAEDAIRKDALAEELLANESYKQYAKALWLKLERAHRPLHDAAQLERVALKEVPPFLSRCKSVSATDRAGLQFLHDESRSLINNYGTTSYGDALRRAQVDAKSKLEALPPVVTASDVMELKRKAALAQSEGRHSDAKDLIAEFLKRPLPPEFLEMIRSLAETSRTKAIAAASSVLQKAQGLVDRGDKAAALQVLECAIVDFRGFKNEMEAFEGLLRKLRPR